MSDAMHSQWDRGNAGRAGQGEMFAHVAAAQRRAARRRGQTRFEVLASPLRDASSRRSTYSRVSQSEHSALVSHTLTHSKLKQ